jgi:hypothetical protein
MVMTTAYFVIQSQPLIVQLGGQECLALSVVIQAHIEELTQNVFHTVVLGNLALRIEQNLNGDNHQINISDYTWSEFN